MSPASYLTIVPAVASLAIGVLVLLHAPRRASNHAFFAFTLGTALWICGFWLVAETHQNSFLPVLNGGGLILVSGLVEFSRTFPVETSLPLPALLFWLPLAVGGAMMVLANSIIRHVFFDAHQVMQIVLGPFTVLWAMLLSSYILISLLFFARTYRAAHPRDRRILRPVFIGTGAFAICAAVCNVILPYLFDITSFTYLGPLSSLLFVGSVAHSMVRYEFMDIRLAVQRSLIYSISFSLLAIFYIGMLVAVEYSIEDNVNVAAPISAGIAMLIGTYTLPYMEIFFRKWTDPIFFTDRYDYFSVLQELSLVLNTHINLRPLALQSLAVLEAAFRPSYSHFVRIGTKECFLHGCIHEPACDETERGVRIPICSRTAIIGEYVLGPKRSGSRYTREDHALIRTFTIQAAVAFEKAELYQTLREYSEGLEAKVLDRTRHLEQLRVQQREFFDDISHALQTPLTVLKSSIALLKVSSPVRSPLHAHIDTSIDNLSRLVGRVLELARIDTRPHESRTRFDFSDLLARIIEYVTVLAEAEDIHVTSAIASPIYLTGDAQQLEEACVNVLSNAVKYTAGCARRVIHISLEAAAGTVILRVCDSGIGMTPEQQSLILERFYRAPSESTDAQGFGLGLAITKRIIERHEGTISFESELGRGTTACITLPCERLAASHS